MSTCSWDMTLWLSMMLMLLIEKITNFCHCMLLRAVLRSWNKVQSLFFHVCESFEQMWPLNCSFHVCLSQPHSTIKLSFTWTHWVTGTFGSGWWLNCPPHHYLSSKKTDVLIAFHKLQPSPLLSPSRSAALFAALWVMDRHLEPLWLAAR